MLSSKNSEIWSNRLRSISQINERVKLVVTMSRQINIGAINARLLARKSGSGSMGFRVAAAELGVFSQQLDNVMQAMEQTIQERLAATAFYLKLNKRRVLLVSASESNEDKCLQVSIDKLTQQVYKVASRVEGGRPLLLAQWARANDLSQSGRVIGRLARLESVYGGTLASAMSSAVLTIEDIVMEIMAILRDLEMQLKGETLEKH